MKTFIAWLLMTSCCYAGQITLPAPVKLERLSQLTQEAKASVPTVIGMAALDDSHQIIVYKKEGDFSQSEIDSLKKVFSEHVPTKPEDSTKEIPLEALAAGAGGAVLAGLAGKGYTLVVKKKDS